LVDWAALRPSLDSDVLGVVPVATWVDSEGGHNGGD
jgi:hypothetical protein